MDNILKTYISNTKKRLKKYNSLILKSKYDKYISDELVQAYIDARYYNYGMDSKIRIFYRRIYNAVKNKGKELTKKEPRKKELIDNTVSLFQYYFYFDNVRDNLEIEEIVSAIAEKRIFKFGLRSALKDNFKEEFLYLIKEDLKEKSIYLDKYICNDFELEFKKLNPKKSNFYQVKLKYNFGFPEIFSKEVIEEVYNTNIVAEDRLFVEYPLIASKVLEEVIDGDFSKSYVCDFATSLFSKKKKLEQLLEILDNQSAQEKICFKISYEEFKKNKKDIFDLIKRGFNFALETNEKIPKLSSEELKILEIFNCIIVSEEDTNKNNYKNIKILEK